MDLWNCSILSCILGFRANPWTGRWFMTWAHVLSTTWRTYFWFCDLTEPRALHNNKTTGNSWVSNTWKCEQEAHDGFICASCSRTVEPRICLNICLKHLASLLKQPHSWDFFYWIHEHVYLSEVENITYTACDHQCQSDRHWGVDAGCVTLKSCCGFTQGPASWSFLRGHSAPTISGHTVQAGWCEKGVFLWISYLSSLG